MEYPGAKINYTSENSYSVVDYIIIVMRAD